MTNQRATELDGSWPKGYSRVAEVYIAQDRLQLAMEAYTKAISLCPKAKRRCTKLCTTKLKKRQTTILLMAMCKYTLQARMVRFLLECVRAAVPTYSLAVPSPLSYLTTVDKLCCAFIPFRTKLTENIDMLNGKNQ